MDNATIEAIKACENIIRDKSASGDEEGLKFYKAELERLLAPAPAPALAPGAPARAEVDRAIGL